MRKAEALAVMNLCLCDVTIKRSQVSSATSFCKVPGLAVAEQALPKIANVSDWIHLLPFLSRSPKGPEPFGESVNLRRRPPSAF